MTKNVDISKTGNENTASLLRKFSRRMQGTGIVRHLRSKRYWARQLSDSVQKKNALRRIAKTEQYQQMLKEGKVSERPQRGHRR